jgi:ribonuclease Y
MSFFQSFSRVLRTGERPAGDTSVKPAQAGAAAPATGSYLKRNRDKSRKPQTQIAPTLQAGLAQRQQQNQPRPQQSQAPVAPAIDPAKLAAAQAELEKAQEAVRAAESRAREILIEAKSDALHIREKAETESRELQSSLVEQQKAVERQLNTINVRLEQVDKRDQMLESKMEALEKQKAELIKKKDDLVSELEKVSGLTRDQAKQEILARLESAVDRQAAQMIQQKTQEAEEEADEKAKEILIDAMKHGATDYVSEYTISVVKLPDPEMKGRIIGKDGRNIRSFERSTGVDVDLDETPDEVRLSSFDPVRREIARISLERLLKDGRIQPTRIDEVVEKVTSELNKIMFEEGKKMCHKVGVFNMPHDIIALLGRFKYRFSYGQNLIAHTLEETQIGIKIANELGLDTRTVTLGCLLHDIGKIIEGEGNHVELGVELLTKYKFPPEVIACVAQHHEDEPFTSMESVAVYISDAISGSRPGARNENHEEYVKRLKKLEEIADSYDGVAKSYAIQAGREVRVILNPDKSSDRDPLVIAQKVAERYEKEMQYPGTVTVNVIRELRGTAIAK